MGRLIDLTGQRFTRLLVIERAGSYPNKAARWRCRCDCGNEVFSTGFHLVRGNVKSCGCYNRQKIGERSITHGAYRARCKTPDYIAYRGMLNRCRADGQDKRYYFERGIVVCARWLKGDGVSTGFECFLADIGPKPGPEYSVDRIENNGNYEPGNVRWALPLVQHNNTRSNRYLIYRGERMTLAQAVRAAGDVIGYSQARHRLGRHKWPVEKAVETPALKPGGKRPKGSHHY